MPDYKLLHNKIYAKIKSAEKILLTTHEKPDIDAVGSVCAFIEILENLGKPYFAYCYDAPPRQFNFIPHIEKIKSDKNLYNFNEFDLIIIFDAGGMKRTRLDEEIINKNKNQFVIEIDHHPKIEEFSDLELRIASASSTTEIIYDFFKLNNIKINKNTANCILAGILADSGNFIFPATSDKTIDISSQMLVRGANLPAIMKNTLHNKSLSALKIWGKAMARIKINKNYNFAYTVLTWEDAAGVNEEDLEGISNFLGNLHGVKGVLLLREQPGGTIRGSLRSSHPSANMTLLAQVLGGGGHAKASGFTIAGKLEKTTKGWRVI